MLSFRFSYSHYLLHITFLSPTSTLLGPTSLAYYCVLLISCSSCMDNAELHINLELLSTLQAS